MDGQAQALWFSEARGVLSVTSKPPALGPGGKARSGILYMVKLLSSPVVHSPAMPLSDQIIVGDITPNMVALEHLSR